MSAHWSKACQDALEEGDGIDRTGLVAPMLCGAVESEDEGDEEEVSAAPSAGLVTMAVEARASHHLALAWTVKQDRVIVHYHKMKKYISDFFNLGHLLKNFITHPLLKNLLGWFSPPI